MGGLGFNVWNPALVGRAFLTAAFPVYLTAAWLPPIDWTKSALDVYLGSGVDAISTATPLYVLRHYGLNALLQQFGGLSVIYQNFFLGWRPGCIGETSALLILAGGLFMIVRGIITWHIPVSTIATVAVLTWIFGGDTWFGGQPLVAGALGWAHAGRILYVHRLCDIPDPEERPSDFWDRSWSAHSNHSYEGRLSGRHLLRDSVDELSHARVG